MKVCVCYLTSVNATFASSSESHNFSVKLFIFSTSSVFARTFSFECQISPAASTLNDFMMFKNLSVCASFKETAKSTTFCVSFGRMNHFFVVSLNANALTEAVIFSRLAAVIAFVACEMIHFIVANCSSLNWYIQASFA